MRNQRLLPIIGILIVAIGVLAGAVFMYKTRKLSASTEKEAAIEQIRESIRGEWLVSDSISTGTDLVFYHFSSETCTCRQGEKTVFECSYEIDQNSHLILQDPKAEYIIENLTDHFYKLVATQNGSVTAILRYKEQSALSEDSIVGQWRVLVHGGTRADRETLTFENQKFVLKKKDKESVSSTYIWKQPSEIVIDEPRINMIVVPYDEDCIYLIEKGKGYVWEIVRE